jgi:hypothetical protein
LHSCQRKTLSYAQLTAKDNHPLTAGEYHDPSSRIGMMDLMMRIPSEKEQQLMRRSSDGYGSEGPHGVFAGLSEG